SAAVPPALDFSTLDDAVKAVKQSAIRYQTVVAGLAENTALDDINVHLLQSERTLTSPEGLPGRPWFKHQIYAPRIYTGYAPKTLPAIREAMEAGNWQEAQRQIANVANILRA